MTPIGEKIKHARIEIGLTQEALADAVGVEPPTISRWESGQIEPRPATLVKIAKAVEKPVSWFTRGDSLEGELLARLDRMEKTLQTFIDHADFDPADVVKRLKSLSPNIRQIVLALIYKDPRLAQGVKVDRAFLNLLTQIEPLKELKWNQTHLNSVLDSKIPPQPKRCLNINISSILNSLRLL